MRRQLAALLLSAAFLATAAHAFAAETYPRGAQLGLSLGTPAILNVEYAFEFGTREVYLSGGYLAKDGNGVEAGVSLERSGTAAKHLSINAIAGFGTLPRFEGDPHRWIYGGVEFNLRYHALFLAPSFVFRYDRSLEEQSGSPILVGRLGILSRH